MSFNLFFNFRTIIFGLIFTIVPFTSFSQDAKNDSAYKLEKFNKERYLMTQKSTKTAYNYFSNGAKYFLKKGDTINHLNCIAHLSDIEHRKGQFNNAFELIWEAMPLAEKISNKMPLVEFHQMLGILYQVYGKETIALKHTKIGLEISKKYSKVNKLYKKRLTSCYLDVAVQYVAMKEYDLAINYLDSCYFVDTSSTRLHFVDAIYSQVYLEKQNYKKAQEYLNGVTENFEMNGKVFQTATNYFQGRIKSAINEPEKAIFYYKKSLKAIDSLQNNLNLKPEVLEKLAFEYRKVNNSDQAFLCLKESKHLSDSLFNIQSKQNKILFEIKNKYKESLSLKEAQLNTQNKMLQLSNQSKFRLRLLIVILVLLVIILIITFRLHSKMKKASYEKLIQKEKSEAIIEVKNKELTTNALQLIEKEQAVSELMEAVMLNSPNLYNKFQTKYKKSNKKIWEDFHLRFTQTNDAFYNKLLISHPDLTSTDLKHCALIRLNFDSKEMSHLLGISINSVHMARSRIRKKLNLTREDSLSAYLGKI